ncbi:MAG: RBBP9/YdeN family alpha/beta hydrolase [Anaeromyxobacteraceae bacterium]
MTAITYVFQAGIGNSEPEHWQSRWARRLPGAVWVDERDWENPVRDAWVAALEDALRRAPGRKVLVAHSLGCLVAAEAAGALAGAGVAGAFLVAVPDVLGPSFPKSAAGFHPALELTLPVPSVVVASTDDPYGSLEHAERVARAWGSRLAAVGAKGHLNARSGLGDWPDGRRLLEGLVASL